MSQVDTMEKGDHSIGDGALSGFSQIGLEKILRMQVEEDGRQKDLKNIPHAVSVDYVMCTSFDQNAILIHGWEVDLSNI